MLFLVVSVSLSPETTLNPSFFFFLSSWDVFLKIKNPVFPWVQKVPMGSHVTFNEMILFLGIFWWFFHFWTIFDDFSHFCIDFDDLLIFGAQAHVQWWFLIFGQIIIIFLIFGSILMIFSFLGRFSSIFMQNLGHLASEQWPDWDDFIVQMPFEIFTIHLLKSGL